MTTTEVPTKTQRAESLERSPSGPVVLREVGWDFYDRDIQLSIAFPFLHLSDVERFLTVARSAGEYAAVIAFRDWLRQTHGRKA